MAMGTEVRTAADIRNLPLRRYGDQGLSAGRVSWGALWSGAFVTTASLLLLSAFGLGFATGTVAGGLTWYFFSVLASFGAGGFIAARMAGIPRRREAIGHGIVNWAVSSVAVVLSLTTAIGSIVGYVSTLVGGAAGTPAGTAAAGAVTRAAPATVAQNIAAGSSTVGWLVFGLLLVGLVGAVGGASAGTPEVSA